MMAGLILLPGDQKTTSKWIAGIGGLIVGSLFGMFTRASFGDWIVPIAIASFGALGFCLNKVFQLFEFVYAEIERKFAVLVKSLIQKYRVVAASLVPAFMLTIFLLNSTPSALIPQEDQNLMYAPTQLASGSSLPATAKVAAQASSILKKEQQSKDSALKDAVVIAGMQGPESLTIATLLKPLQDRPQKSQGADAQQRSLAAKLFSLPTAFPPAFF